MGIKQFPDIAQQIMEDLLPLHRYGYLHRRHWNLCTEIMGRATNKSIQSFEGATRQQLHRQPVGIGVGCQRDELVGLLAHT
jgi:hypothetical protein